MRKNLACSMWVLSLVVLTLIVSPANGLTCREAVLALIPCGPFLVGATAPKPSNQCCESAQELNKMAATVETRRVLCECQKKTGPSYGVKPERAKLLRPLCKLTISIPVSPNVQCYRYNKMDDMVKEEHCITFTPENYQAIYWGCRLGLILPSDAPSFKCY